MYNDSITAGPTPRTITCGRLSMIGPTTDGMLLVDVSASPLPPELAIRRGWHAHTAYVDLLTTICAPDDWILCTRPGDALPVYVRPGEEPADGVRLGVVDKTLYVPDRMR